MSTSKPKSKTSANSAPQVSEFYLACRDNDIDAVTALLPELSAEEIDRMEPNGSTALHAAAYYGNRKIVKMLLSKGAERTIKNRYGSTPYDEAKTEEIKKLLGAFQRVRPAPENRFVSASNPEYEWIFVDNDPSSYASFNRGSLMKCETKAEFRRLCRGIRQDYIGEKGSLEDVEGVSVIRSYFDKAIENNDPTELVRAYTEETGFYGRLNEDLSQMPTHWSGIRHERSFVSILMFHPVFEKYMVTGVTYRGMLISPKDLKKYKVGTVFMNKTVLSSSTDRRKAQEFTERKQSHKKVKVICRYTIKCPSTALDIQSFSVFGDEKEVLILPYAAFRVTRIREPSGQNEDVTKIEAEEEEQVEWANQHPRPSSPGSSLVHKSSSQSSSSMYKSSSQSRVSVHESSSQRHVSVRQVLSSNQSNFDSSHIQMRTDARSKGMVEHPDLTKWKKNYFGIDLVDDPHAQVWAETKKGKGALVKWGHRGDDSDGSDVESFDGGTNAPVFTASNQQSHATSKTFRSKQQFDMEKLMAHSDEDSNGERSVTDHNMTHF
ncbi:hypothetical protein I4U23_022319 [Adineta vaga]|nr:hypothetical protein I4U23_022319 [Adineta vaga]